MILEIYRKDEFVIILVKNSVSVLPAVKSTFYGLPHGDLYRVDGALVPFF